MKRISLTIPSPCTESWDSMTSTNGGKFCAHCQHEVTDFTGMSDAEIINFLSKAKGKVCGRTRKEQLNRQLLVRYNHYETALGQMVGGIVIAFNGQLCHCAKCAANTYSCSTTSTIG